MPKNKIIVQLTKTELITRTSGQCGLPVDQGKEFVKKLFENIANGLQERGRVEITGWGTFELDPKGERIARNPKTGEEVKVEPRDYIKFSPGKFLKEKSSRIKKGQE